MQPRMSLAQATAAIDQFLRSPDPGVLAINGPWGVGKTYFWSNAVEAASHRRLLPLEHYSYVSLFGLSSIEDLRYAIFEHRTKRERAGQSVSVDTLRDNFLSVGGRTGKKIFGRALPAIPWLAEIGPAIRSAAFMLVKDCLVCLDDFERKSKSLDITAILGVVTELKEQKHCKVVLIFDDQKFEDPDDGQRYVELREKVVDIEIGFLPIAQESAGLVFADLDPQTRQVLVEASTALGIRNLRVMQRIKRISEDVVPALARFDPLITTAALRSLALFMASRYGHDQLIPPLAFLRDLDTTYAFIARDKLPENERAWLDSLDRYGYRSTDDLDRELILAAERGYVDREAVMRVAALLHSSVEKEQKIAAYREAWDLYRGSFEDNEEHFVDRVTATLLDAADAQGPDNLNQVVSLLRRLQRNDEADALIDAWIQRNRNRPQMFDTNSEIHYSTAIDPRMKEQFEKEFAPHAERVSLQEAIVKVSGDSWTRAEQDAVERSSADDLYQLFKSMKGRPLYLAVKACLSADRFSQKSTVAQNTSDVLLRLAAENSINRIRVTSMYGIELPKRNGDR